VKCVHFDQWCDLVKWQTCRFHRTRGISWTANKILPCQELFLEESVSYLSTYFTYAKLFNVIHFLIIVNLKLLQQETQKMRHNTAIGDVTHSPDTEHILGANNAPLSHKILQTIHDEIRQHNGTVIHSPLNFMNHSFHISRKFCVGITVWSLESLHIQFQQDRQLNKDRPTWCHLLYYVTIYCSTCFEC